jgi:hypothetical protein
MEAATMSDRLTIAMNTNNKAPSQYLSIPFDSAVELNGKLVWFGETGVFEEGGATDNDEEILAWVDTPIHDFGRREQKSIEAFDVGYESSGSLALTLYGDEDVINARSFTLMQSKTGQVQQDGTQTLKKYRYGKARYWKVRIANVDGCDFSVDYLALAPVVLKRRPRNG